MSPTDSGVLDGGTGEAGAVDAAAVDANAVSRVVLWADQSGRHDDASLRQVPPQLGPQCRVGGHSVKGIDLPYFSAPQNGNVLDETLDVDLAFLVNSEYSIFVVERRWADYPDGVPNQDEHILGTTVPMSIEMAGRSAWCNPYPVDQVLQLGYFYYNGPPQLGATQGCAGGVTAMTTTRVPTPPPAPLSQETYSLDMTRGHNLWVNGAPSGADAYPRPLVYA